MRYSLLSILAMSLALFASCAKPPRAPEEAATAATPEARLLQIPPANPEKYRNVRDYKDWKNPYLFIRKDGVALLDVSNNEQRLVNPDDLPEILAELPIKAWPYGRVVAVGQVGIPSSGDDAAVIRKNRGIVLGTLESLHIVVPDLAPPG